MRKLSHRILAFALAAVLMASTVLFVQVPEVKAEDKTESLYDIDVEILGPVAGGQTGKVKFTLNYKGEDSVDVTGYQLGASTLSDFGLFPEPAVLSGTLDKAHPITKELTCKMPDSWAGKNASVGFEPYLQKPNPDAPFGMETVYDSAKLGLAYYLNTQYKVQDGQGWNGKKQFSVDGDFLTYYGDVVNGKVETEKYYKLNFDLGEGVVLPEYPIVYGGNGHSMTTELRDKDNHPSFWTSGHICDLGCMTSLSFDVKDMSKYPHCEVIPASAGKIVVHPIGDTNATYFITSLKLTAPATIKITLEDKATLTDQKSNVCMTVANAKDWGNYIGVDFVAEKLEGTAADNAASKVLSTLGNGSQAIAYNTHLAIGDLTPEMGESDTATITMPIPDSWYPEDTVVYSVSDDGTIADMSAIADKATRTISFNTNKLTTFVLAAKPHVHTWDNGVVTKEPTADGKGIISKTTYTCSVCGKTNVELKITNNNSVKTDGPSTTADDLTVKVESSDDKSISVAAANSILPANTTMKTQKVESGETYETAKKLVTEKIKNHGNYAVFDLNLMDGNNVELHQLKGKVQVTMDAPIQVAAGNTIKVYRVNGDELVECSSSVSDGRLTFETDHFSTYVFVEQPIAKTSPEMGDVDITLYLSLLAIAFVMMAGVILHKKIVK